MVLMLKLRVIQIYTWNGKEMRQNIFPTCLFLDFSHDMYCTNWQMHTKELSIVKTQLRVQY